MSWTDVADVAGAVCLVLGSTLTLVAAIAVFRFRDLLARMHAATKPQVLGLTLMMTGVALTVRNPVVVWTLVLVVAFQLITSPISAHMVGRAGYRTGKVDPASLAVDELTEDLEASLSLSDEEVVRRLATLADVRGSADGAWSSDGGRRSADGARGSSGRDTDRPGGPLSTDGRAPG